ncbi:protein of unknown function DUF1113 [Catovirus CTV1]|uniref:Uncharacterized protein n=1 Tax=Catovirus CTV1 TaxID=1977631 RepID=A0A1V0SC22_9VIRU|nr:protein of unknown function DUF1113 [Catovirus CTV1]
MTTEIIANIIAFFVYSYMGSTLESMSYYFMGRTYYYKLTNPVITAFPLYGIGAFLFIFVDYLLNYTGINNIDILFQLIIKVLVLGFVASVLEYITGKYFSNAGRGANPGCILQDWDYSNEPLNIDGIVSFRHMLLWGMLGITIVYTYPYLMKFLSCGLNCLTK